MIPLRNYDQSNNFWKENKKLLWSNDPRIDGYYVNEVFYSIQGEGRYAGTPAVFIRFGMCNLTCSFCDTNYNVFDKISYDDLLNKILAFPCKHYVFTGGEPTLQNIVPLVLELSLKGAGEVKITIETNGIEHENYHEAIRHIDWITVSPKTKEFFRGGNELKVLWSQVMKHWKGDLSAIPLKDDSFAYYYVQPEFDLSKTAKDENGGMKDLPKIKDALLANPNWKLSLQTHKWIGMR